MLQYDLSDTGFFRCESSACLPNDAEMLAVTVALLVTHQVAYSQLNQCPLELVEAELERVAQCIEYRLAVFVHDMGSGEQLRARLREFVGIRITDVSPRAQRKPKPG